MYLTPESAEAAEALVKESCEKKEKANGVESKCQVFNQMSTLSERIQVPNWIPGSWRFSSFQTGCGGSYPERVGGARQQVPEVPGQALGTGPGGPEQVCQAVHL